MKEQERLELEQERVELEERVRKQDQELLLVRQVQHSNYVLNHKSIILNSSKS